MIEKIVSKMKKIDKREILISIFFLILSLVCFAYRFDKGDTLWNFGDICKMCYGQVIYKDVNIIHFPLFFFFGKIFVNLLGKNFFGYIIYGVILGIAFIECNYLLLKKLIKSRKVSLIVISILYMFLFRLELTANYNNLAMIFYTLGIICLIKNDKNWIAQIILIILTLLSKQNIGAYYAISYVVYMLFSDRNLKEKIKMILKTGFGSLGIFLVFLGILYFKGILLDFLNYTVFGMLDFVDQNKTIEELGIALILIWILNAIFFVFDFFKIRNRRKMYIDNEYNKMLAMFVFSTFSILTIIPVGNTFHSSFPFVFNLFTLLYLIYICFKKSEIDFLNKKKTKVIIKYLSETLICFLVIWNSFFAIYNLNKAIKVYINNYKISKYDELYGALVSDEMIEKREKVQNYIIQNKQNGINVIVCSEDAMIYNLKLGIYNKDFDLMLKGNLGYNGVERINEEILKMKNVKFMIKKEKEFTIEDNVIKYIKEKYEKIEEIEDFDVYYLK